MLGGGRRKHPAKKTEQSKRGWTLESEANGISSSCWRKWRAKKKEGTCHSQVTGRTTTEVRAIQDKKRQAETAFLEYSLRKHKVMTKRGG